MAKANDKTSDGLQAILKGSEVVSIPADISVVPVRDLVVFPYAVVPLIVGRDKTLAALEAVRDQDKMVLIATQKDAEKEDIKTTDIYRVGTIARVLQVLQLPNGFAKVVVEGIIRARIVRFKRNSRYFEAQIEIFEEEKDLPKKSGEALQQLAYYFQEYLKLSSDLPEELYEHLQQQGDPYRMIDFVALNLQTSTKDKQKILAEPDVEKRLQQLISLLQYQIGYQRVRQQIDIQVQENLMKNQRDYYEQEKLKIIKKELGEEEEASPELIKLRQQIKQVGMPPAAEEKAMDELDKLKKIPPYSPEYTVVRNYLDWMVTIPWSARSEDRMEIKTAQKILDEDHFGLEKPKERIIEHLAVLKRVKKMKGPILCLVGPPGVGKTSLGKSIARALGRNFVRVSLGGVRDEAEIRGHRRTYIGSMPGKILQSMKKAGTRNPVFLMDEIDKMSYDFHGDPASALLEVLDPEQNKSFNDHYLDVDYDLSEVFFITTANEYSGIPYPLLDRMEVIELPGYLEHEKIKIAQLHLIPKQLREHGLEDQNITFEEEAILRMIRDYTREAGVRNLERTIATVCRKITRKLAEKPRTRKIKVSKSNLTRFLGKPEYLNRKAVLKKEVGLATGLAWTAYGGDILKIEVSVLPGKGELTLTGKLGEVMQESAQTALTYARSLSNKLKIDPKIFDQKSIHIHVPEGAIPKDGPSAGITIATAIISAITGRKVRNDIAMTGEITLRGNILAIGGLNEKLLAAQRNNLTKVLIPRENHKDLSELPKELRNGIEIKEVGRYPEVMKEVLE